MKTVFLLENDPDILFVLESWLTMQHVAVHGFSTAKDLLQPLIEIKPKTIVLDYHTLLINDNKTFCRDLKVIHNFSNPVILLSSYPLSLTDPIHSFVDKIITKPFELEEITTAVHAALNLV